jgi:hypothetical protein
LVLCQLPVYLLTKVFPPCSHDHITLTGLIWGVSHCCESTRITSSLLAALSALVDRRYCNSVSQEDYEKGRDEYTRLHRESFVNLAGLSR